MTHQEVLLNIAIDQRNAAQNATLGALLEVHIQKERAEALQKELDALNSRITPTKGAKKKQGASN